ncbi:MAG: TetR family transcriptional regulator [candidate division Zixibacteria bacterium]|nr:TetR family transcriptional regulator [candidate division Zixibacteria bacterium]
MNRRVVLKPTVRSGHILSAAVNIIKTQGWGGLTRGRIANEAGCAVGTVNNVFTDMGNLRNELMNHVIQLIETGDHCDELVLVVAAGLGRGDENAKRAPRMVKDLALLMMGRD